MEDPLAEFEDEPIEAPPPPPGADIEDGGGSFIENIRWVARCLSDRSKAGDAPSLEAAGLLKWATRDDKTEDMFWKEHYQKLVPSKQAIEDEQRRRELQGQQLELVDLVQKAALRAEIEVQRKREEANEESHA